MANEVYTKLQFTDIFTGEVREITNILQGFTLTENANDTMDSGTIIFLDSDPKPLREFSLVRIPYKPLQVDSPYKELVVAMDNSVQRVKIEGKEDYKHTVGLVEKTAILEKILVPNLMLTNPNDTLLTQLDKAIANALPKCLDGNYLWGDPKLNQVILLLSAELKAIVGSRKGEDFRFSGANMKEILEEMLSPLGIFPIVSSLTTDSDGILRIEVGYKDPNVIIGDGSFGTAICTEMKNDICDFGGRIITIASGAIPSNACVESSIRAKAQGEDLTSDNLFLSLKHPIENLLKVYLYADMTALISTDTDSIRQSVLWTTHYTFGFDITDMFVDSEYFELLKMTEKQKHIPYIRGEKAIDLNNQYKVYLTTKSVFHSEVNERIKALIIKNQETIKTNHSSEITNKEGNNSFTNKLSKSWSGNNVQITINSGNGIDLREAKAYFSVEYIPRLDYLCDIGKPDCHNAKEAILGMYDSQSANSPDPQRLGTNLLGKITRIGKDIVCKDDKVYSYADLKPLQTSIDEKYIIYQRDLSIFDRFIKARYYMAEGYNNYSAKISVKRERQIYKIPLAGVECIIPTKSYIYFSDTEPTRYLPHLNTLALKKIANALVGISGEVIDRALIKVYYANGGTENGVFELPTASFAGGNTFGCKMSFMDNYSSGYSYNKAGEKTWYGVAKKAAVSINPYCDANGEFRRIAYMLMSGRSTTTDSLLNALPVTSESYYSEANRMSWLRTTAYCKDKEQSISIQACFELLSSDNDKIITGEKLSACNGLFVKGVDKPYLYISNARYSRNEIFRVKGERSNTQISELFDVEVDNSVVALRYKSSNNVCVAWAIGDEDGNLLLAVNGSLVQNNKIYISSDILLS